jgi:hypothetical protein
MSAHDAIVQDVRNIIDIKSRLAAASGRAVTLLQRRLQDAEGALKRRFDALWAFPAQLVGSTESTDRKSLLEKLDSLLKRDLVERPTYPTCTGYVELKYKLSDLDVALTKASTHLPVAGYFQSAPAKNIDSINLLRCFTAEWIPVDGKDGTKPIANGPDKTLHISMCMCAAILQSLNAVQPRYRFVFAQIHRI